MEGQTEQSTNKRIEIKNNVIKHFSNITNLLESGTSLMDKVDVFTAEDVTKALDMASGIEEEGDEVIRLLFDLRDLIEKQQSKEG